MPKYASADLRNVALVGHGSVGKTTLSEAMLYKAGVIKRMGSVKDGNTVSDFESEEKSRSISLSCSILHCNWKGKEFNILDAPGYMDFICGAIEALSAAETAIVCISAVKGIEVNTRRVWEIAGRMGLGRAIVITKCDGDNAKPLEILGKVQQAFGAQCLPAALPIGEGAGFKGVSDLLGRAEGADAAARGRLMEKAIEVDDALMEKYLETGEVDEASLASAFPKAVGDGVVVPVFFTAAEKELGVEGVMDGIAGLCPSPLAAKRKTIDGAPVTVKPDGPMVAQVFKITSDPFVGKLCYLRLFSGSAKAPATPFSSSSGKTERLSQLLRPQGKEQQDVGEAICGDLVAVAKVEGLRIGDTLSAEKLSPMAPPQFPIPMVSLAVEPKSRNDEQKIVESLRRMIDEDPTCKLDRNAQTRQTVLSGMGNLHLEVILAKVKERFQVEMTTKLPKVPYLETVTAVGDVRYRHKKQTGGAGQFGECAIKIEPTERGKGFEFVDDVVGGVIPGPFIPSVEKGVRDAMTQGIVAGYPVVDVRVSLYDGKSHPVDSKDIAFQIAGRMAFKEAMAKAKPVLLEPVVKMEIAVPSRFMGDITGDVTGRRGRIAGMDSLSDEMQVVKATVPLAEITTYSTELRSLTGGEGSYTVELSHYDVVPGNIAQAVIAKAKQEAEQEK